MATYYRHTQPGYLVLGAMTAGALYALRKLMTGAARPPFLGMAALFGTVGVLFSSLTIEIGDGVLRSSFGPGIPAKTVALADVESAEVVKNPWYFGWGIKYTPHGWLYNVSGLDAVEIRLKRGEQFRLGTDEPGVLRDAILEARDAQA